MNAPETKAAVAALAEPKIELIPLTSIAPGENHVQKLRRRRYNMESLADLRVSIAKLGVQQPIIVRPLKALRGGAKYEIVAGERRWRAAGQAGHAHVPAIVRELADAEALEIQLVENIQRETLHPLEEAEGYRELMALSKLAADVVGDRLGMSRSWVYSRLNLLKLEGEARVALEDGRLDLSRALVVATVAQPNQRAEALKLALERGYNDKPTYSVRELRAKILAEKLTMPLRGAPFPMDDAKLLPEMGACGPCRFRTGNCDPEALDPDVCTNMSCFQLKVKAAGELTRRAAEEAGRKVLTGEAARKLSPSVKTVYDHVDLDERCGMDEFPEEAPKAPKGIQDDEGMENWPPYMAWREREGLWQPRTYRALLEGLKYTSVVIEDPKTKAVRELLPFKEAQLLLKKKGIDLPSWYNRKRPSPHRGASGNDQKAQARAEAAGARAAAARDREVACRRQILKEAFPKIKATINRETLRSVLEFADLDDEILELLFGHADLRKLTEADLVRLLVADASGAIREVGDTWGQAKNLQELAASVKLNTAAIRKRVAKELEKAMPAAGEEDE